MITIYTDGACSGNPGIGGWGAIITANGATQEISGHEDLTTNNRMEMRAVIEALTHLQTASNVTLYTDSQYVKLGITAWIKNWKRNGWRTSDKKPVKNADLWQQMDELSNMHSVQWEWVRGHDLNPGNERADFLAREAVRVRKLHIIR